MQLTTISGKSPLASAIRYALTSMDRLRPYLDHGILELDNSAAERGMRAGFLFWVWLSMIVIILGGEINGELEHQTAMDTTTGPDNPMGQRGAVMADTLGAESDQLRSGP